MPTNIFLKAEWRHLVMLNYVADPGVLQPRVPAGTELDYFYGQTYVSIVGFRFLRTRVCGIAFPFHTEFEEVNLRFYVRRGDRRGVVFVRELVPRAAIAWVARNLYEEPYRALPMRQDIVVNPSGITAEYGWRRAGQWETLHAAAPGLPQPMLPGSEEEFIAEHYWGYTGRRTGTCEYQVEHPRWNVWRATDAALEADAAGLYGPEFAGMLAGPPASAFIADGSAVTVRRATVLPAHDGQVMHPVSPR